MALNLKMVYFPGLQSSLELKEKSIHLHTGHNGKNWSTEIESFNINFVHISGKDNVLANTLSRLIDTDSDLRQQPELEDCEFGKYCFETLPKVRGSIHHQKVGGEEFDVCEIQITYNNPKNLELSVELPLDDEKFIFLQEQDINIQDLRDKVKNGMYKEFNVVKNNVLYSDPLYANGHKFKARPHSRVTSGCSAASRPQSLRTQCVMPA